MALYRQTGAERFAIRGHDFRQVANGNGAGGGGSDQISIRIPHKQGRGRRRADKSRRISVGTFAVIICLILAVTVFAFSFISRNKENNDFNNNQDDDGKIDMDFLSNVTRTKGDKVVKFGRGSGAIGRDSRYWDRDDRRRDDEYDADALELANSDDVNQSTKKDDTLKNEGNGSEQLADVHVHRKSNGKPGEDRRGAGLYNEAGRDELKLYEAEYEASLKNIGQSSKGHADGLGLLHYFCTTNSSDLPDYILLLPRTAQISVSLSLYTLKNRTPTSSSYKQTASISIHMEAPCSSRLQFSRLGQAPLAG